MAFQSNAFQNNAFQVIGGEVVGVNLRKIKRKRYVINDEVQYLTEAELRDTLQAMVNRQSQSDEPRNPPARLKGRGVPKEVRYYADIEAVYRQMAEVDRSARILKEMAHERMLDEEDEIAILLGAM